MPRRLTLPRAYWADRTILAALIFTTAWLSLTLARGPGELAAIWVGNGILVGWLLSRRTATWPGYLLVAYPTELLARVLAGDAAPIAIAIATCNLAEVLVVAGSVRRLVPDTRDPQSWMRLGGIATAATLVACALSGLLAAAFARLLVDGRPYLPALAQWFAAHVVGTVIAATTTLVAQREGIGLFIAPNRRWSLAATLALVVAVGIAVFLTASPVLFLSYPPLLLMAVRHRFAGVGLGVIALALTGAVATAQGLGPFGAPTMDTGQRIALLQLFIAGACLMTIPVCLALVERDRLAARLRESERLYRMLADHSHDAIVRIGADGQLAYVSPSAVEMTGWPPRELAGSPWDLVHPDDRALQQEAIHAAFATDAPRTDIYRMRHRDGHDVWVEAVSRRIPADDGNGYDLMITARNINKRKAAEQALAESRRELERQSRVDALTDLPNRRQFDERLDLALKRVQRHRVPIALLCLDLDRFKAINDGYGHAAGDAVLQAFARRLCDSVRETDLVARLGGDEFAILLEDVPPGGAEAVARKVVACMADPVEAASHRLQVATSVGVACTEQPTEPATLMAKADAALYVAKHAGRNRYHIAD